jgi:hypothetical protein
MTGLMFISAGAAHILAANAIVRVLAAPAGTPFGVEGGPPVARGGSAAVVRVEGATSCPTPGEVAAKLESLLPTASKLPRPDRAQLADDGGDLLISLEDATGAVLGTRRLPRQFPCDALAAAAAIALAAWESDVHPAFAPALAPVPRPREETITVLPPRTAADAPVASGVALGLVGGFAGGVPRPGVQLVAGAWLRPWRLGLWGRTLLRAEAGGDLDRRLEVAEGGASWRRLGIGLGLEGPLTSGAGQAAHGEPEATGWLRWFAVTRLAWLRVRGDGFAVNHAADAVDPGVAAGLRALFGRPFGRSFRSLGLWSSVELALVWWPLPHDVRAAELQTAADAESPSFLRRLPVTEVYLRGGVGFGGSK